MSCPPLDVRPNLRNGLSDWYGTNGIQIDTMSDPLYKKWPLTPPIHMEPKRDMNPWIHDIRHHPCPWPWISKLKLEIAVVPVRIDLIYLNSWKMNAVNRGVGRLKIYMHIFYQARGITDYWSSLDVYVPYGTSDSWLFVQIMNCMRHALIGYSNPMSHG